jgi:hypothetical protein
MRGCIADEKMGESGRNNADKVAMPGEREPLAIIALATLIS